MSEVEQPPPEDSPLDDAPAGGETQNHPHFLVVGVGASAGGLDAFLRLVRPIPGDANLALIFVQHMSREHESMLPHLLAAQTGLKVDEGIDGRRIEPGHLYVLRPNTHMSVSDGILQVVPRPTERVLDAPVDHLFDSMALHYGEKAVGVLLSGGGRDGVLGLERIHGGGGITIAQEPEQAQVDGMPRAAIGLGAAELVLPAEKIADELLRLSEHPFFRDEAPSRGDEHETAPVSLDSLAPVLQTLRRETGVDFARYKQATVQRRVRRRMALHRSSDVPSYLKLLREDASEVGKLHDDILIHVTSFFRDPGSFEALKGLLAARPFAERDEATPVRAWVPGCSSGEEAYSIAITLLEALGKDTRTSVLVFGTDLSQRMIDRARAGVYSESIAREVPPELLERYFSKLDGAYRVSAFVRERCVFARQDITHDPPFSKLDLVACRNVLIYLDQPAQAKVIGVFHYALMPDGLLMLGRSETAGAHTELFTLADGRWKIYTRRAGGARLREVEFSSRVAPIPSLQVGGVVRRRQTRSPDQELQAEANRVLLERYAPPAIVVDDKMTIVRSQGATATYLELPTGDVNLDVLRMIRPGLMSPLRSALQEAADGRITVRKAGLQFVAHDKVCEVTIEVTPLGGADNRHYLILFDGADALRRSEPTVVAEPAVAQLQQELADTRMHLQSMIQELESANEELQAANEEILSSNEELQSTNEELDTAREELQSSNEELSTVNDELHTRNTDLSRANSDLTNLLGSVQIPIVMVTADARIRRFTPAAERLLNLIPSDIGRPIGHIKPNVVYPDLEQVMLKVVETVATDEREVEDTEGHTYVATARPYKSVDHRIDGAVLALFDVSSTLQAARDAGEAIISTVRDAVIMLDSDHSIRRVNHGFTEYFGHADASVHGKSLFQIAEGRWDIPALRYLLQEVLPRDQRVQDFEVELDLPSFGKRRFCIDGRCIESKRKGERVIWLIVREATHGKSA